MVSGWNIRRRQGAKTSEREIQYDRHAFHRAWAFLVDGGSSNDEEDQV